MFYTTTSERENCVLSLSPSLSHSPYLWIYKDVHNDTHIPLLSDSLHHYTIYGLWHLLQT